MSLSHLIYLDEPIVSDLPTIGILHDKTICGHHLGRGHHALLGHSAKVNAPAAPL